jgi:hypothetical protein
MYIREIQKNSKGGEKTLTLHFLGKGLIICPKRMSCETFK